MIKNFFAIAQSLVSISLITIALHPLSADDKRTDGKPGSEYADFSSWDGDWRVGAEFGALVPTSDSAKTAFTVGLDVDFRPYELFGFRTSFLQGFKSPKLSLISMTPFIHTVYSNFMPYALVGPGIAIVNVGGTEAKFMISLGAGADIAVVERFAVGMLWTYNALFDAFDVHTVTARFSYKF